MNRSSTLLALVLLFNAGLAQAAPELKLGEPENYCVTYCYIREPFEVIGYDANRRIGRIFCEFEAEISAKLPVHQGEIKTKYLKASPIGVFTNKNGSSIGDVEIDTGVIKNYLIDAKLKRIECHF